MVYEPFLFFPRSRTRACGVRSRADRYARACNHCGGRTDAAIADRRAYTAIHPCANLCTDGRAFKSGCDYST